MMEGPGGEFNQVLTVWGWPLERPTWGQEVCPRRRTWSCGRPQSDRL